MLALLEIAETWLDTTLLWSESGVSFVTGYGTEITIGVVLTAMALTGLIIGLIKQFMHA